MTALPRSLVAAAIPLFAPFIVGSNLNTTITSKHLPIRQSTDLFARRLDTTIISKHLPIRQSTDLFARRLECDLECENGGECKILSTADRHKYSMPERCICPKGFAGVTCELTVDPCFTDDDGTEKHCQFGAPCKNGSCDCDQAFEESAFAGKQCEFPATAYCSADFKSFCTNGGTCTKNVAPGEDHRGCACPKEYEGPHCEFLVGTMPGEKCNLECENGGECKILSTADTHKYGMPERCICPAGFAGITCELTVDACFSDENGNESHCKYGAPCVNGECDCDQAFEESAFAGKQCEFPATIYCTAGLSKDSFCTNGGWCKELEPGETHRSCHCPSDFEGPHCEFLAGTMPGEQQGEDDTAGGESAGEKDGDTIYEQDDCTLDCKNGGDCQILSKEEAQKYTISERCVCPKGFSGSLCELVVAACFVDEGVEKHCENGAPCVQGGCDCTQTYELGAFAGKECEYPATIYCTDSLSKESFCANGGVCIKNVEAGEEHPGCYCPGGFDGRHCELLVGKGETAHKKKNHTNIHHHNATVAQEKKEMTKEKYKCNLDCENGGHCQILSLSDTHKFGMPERCICPKGFAGITCELRVDACFEDAAGSGEKHCQYGAPCVNGECDCDQAFSRGAFAGKECEFPATVYCSTDLSTDGFCTNGGTCKRNVEPGETHRGCHCPSDFEGPHCEFLTGTMPGEQSNKDVKDMDVTCDLECENGGQCKIFGRTDVGQSTPERCICPKGFAGIICEVKVDACFTDGDGNEFHCQHGAPCVNAKCDCDQAFEESAFAGKQCEHPATVYCGETLSKESFCTNGGTCKKSANRGEHGGCDCRPGFEGDYCEFFQVMPSNDNVSATKENDVIESCDLDCKNGGICEVINLADQVAHRTNLPERCVCPEGYAGIACELTVEPCLSSKEGHDHCQNGAKCLIYTDVNGHKKQECDCNQAYEMSAFAGKECEHPATMYCSASGGLSRTSFCTNGGTCREHVNAGEEHRGCDCPTEFQGPHCEFLAVKEPAAVSKSEEETRTTSSTGSRIMYGFIILALVVSLAGLTFLIRRLLLTKERKTNVFSKSMYGASAEVATDTDSLQSDVLMRNGVVWYDTGSQENDYARSNLIDDEDGDIFFTVT